MIRIKVEILSPVIQYLVDDDASSARLKFSKGRVLPNFAHSLFLVASLMALSISWNHVEVFRDICNSSCSLGVTIASIFGNIICALSSPATVPPKEWGSNLNDSAYT
jgi:hypothetical protein